MIDFNDASPPERPIRYDLDEIVRRLRDAADAWVPRLFPKGRREGDEWRLANIRGDAPRKQGSCVVALGGERAGDWYDHDGGAGGGPLSTLEQGTGLSGRDLYAHAADLAGWSPETPAREHPVRPAAPERDPAREIAFILDHARPVAATIAANYLAGRGLQAPETADLAFHPNLTHWQTRSGHPALIGIVRDRDGGVVALQRTYLGQDGNGRAGKAGLQSPRMMLGKVAGGAVRLAGIGPDGRLGLCEGIETGLAAMAAVPGLPVWATLSTSHLEQVQLPPEARDIVILADHDASGAGTRAADTAARRLRAEGRRVAVVQPPQAGEDFNDFLLREGADAVAATILPAWEPADGEEPDMEPLGRHLPIGFVPPGSPLPAMRADEGDLARAGDRAWSLLLASNRTPWLFRTGNTPTWVVPDDGGRPMALPLSEERLRYMLAKLAFWRRIGRNDELVPAPPPTLLLKTLMATPDPGLPVLAGIVTAPVFGRGGSLLTEPGYHPGARLLYQPIPGFVLPPVPERPTAQETAEAKRLLLDDLLGEFPFVSPAERAHAVALLLLGFVRAMIDGPTPLHLIEKPTAGTGATLMVDAVTTILTGSPATVMTESDNDEEWRKRITAKLRQIPSIILIDNLKLRLNSPAFAAALTAPYWEDRILGVSETARLPIRCVWIATGNNPEFSNEMARRIVRVRLDAHMDQPWRREGFRHPDLMEWVRANRPRLVAACLTLVRAWIAAGRPFGARTIGSFEGWARIMGGILQAVGIEGFLDNLDDLMDASDAEGATWRAFVAAWWERFGTAEVGTGDLYDLALVCEPPLPLGAGNDRSQRTRLGRALGKMRDRVFDIDKRGLRIAALGVSHKVQRWRLVAQDAATKAVFEGDVVQSGGTSSAHVPLENDTGINGLGYVGYVGDVFPTPTHTGARTHAHVGEIPQQRTPRPPCPPTISNDTEISGGGDGGRPDGHPPRPPIPDWLKEVQ